MVIFLVPHPAAFSGVMARWPGSAYLLYSLAFPLDVPRCTLFRCNLIRSTWRAPFSWVRGFSLKGANSTCGAIAALFVGSRLRSRWILLTHIHSILPVRVVRPTRRHSLDLTQADPESLPLQRPFAWMKHPSDAFLSRVLPSAFPLSHFAR